MKILSFAQNIIQERGGGIRFIQALEDGKPCWFYLEIDENKITDYKKKLESGEMNISDYGKILESDWGDYPQQDVIRYMKQEYNFVTPDP